jgi:hypothetical protein
MFYLAFPALVNVSVSVYIAHELDIFLLVTSLEQLCEHANKTDNDTRACAVELWKQEPSTVER